MSVSAPEQHSERWCERLYEQKAAQLLLYGRALGLCRAEAEDVLQETFVALLKLEETPQEPDHYLFRAFRNRALNGKRSLWRRLRRELEASQWFEHSEDISPVEQEAMRCLAKLPPEQREVIVLRIWSELKYEEIGSLLELSPNTVAGRYRYGLEKLRACLKGDVYERLEFNREPLANLGASATLA